jgi:tRNA(Arg) A34 adenosine deaminase TadA
MFIFTEDLIRKIGSENHQHYCVITHGGKVITSGFNRPCWFTHNGKDYMRHAECDALLKLPTKYRNKKIRLCVIRNGYKNSKPCQKCLEFISSFNVKNIYYSDIGCLWDEPFSTIHSTHVSMKYLKN